jgi:hypothetical protein
MTEDTSDRHEQADGPSGFCKRCGRALDDHDHWLTDKGPTCPQPKGAIKK